MYYNEQALDIDYSPLGDLFVYGRSDGYVVCAKSPFFQENREPGLPDIEGPDKGVPGTEYIYVISAVDPDNDDVRYYIDWGDKTYEVTDYYSSGMDLIVKHTWNVKGSYIITVYAEDLNGLSGPENKLTVNIPRNRISNITFLRLLQRFLEMSPIILRLFAR